MYACDGLTDQDDADGLVVGGEAVAFVELSIGDLVGSDDVSRTLMVSDVELLAGDLPEGEPSSLQVEPEADKVDPFPPGRYAMLLGRTHGKEGTYFLSDGVPGSFAVADDRLQQRCPNLQDPTSPIASDQGVTDRGAVIALFDRALSSKREQK